MVDNKLKPQLVTEVFEGADLMAIVSVHEIAYLNVFVGLPFGQGGGNIHQVF